MENIMSMIAYSNCSGSCLTCITSPGTNCLSGKGDDDYVRAPDKELINRLDNLIDTNIEKLNIGELRCLEKKVKILISELNINLDE